MDFCMRVASEVITNEVNENPNKKFVMSPFSLNCLLNMLASGTKGRTLEQLLEFLESESVSDVNTKSSQMINLVITMNGESNSKEGLIFPNKRQKISLSEIEKLRRMNGPELSFVGGIWADRKFPIKPSFKQIIKDVYKAQAKTMDFESQVELVRKEVNMWAEKKAKGIVTELIPHGLIDKDTKLILANALYFKGKWSDSFDESMTQHEDFHLLNGKTVKVPLMRTYSERFYFASCKEFKILKLPYARGQDNKEFSMYIFLPRKNNGLQEMMQNFNSQSMFLQKNLPLQEVTLSKVFIPRFKFSYEFEASEISKKLELTLPFTIKGDFTEMVDCSDNELIYVSKILHKSFIEMNEDGTEGSALSAILQTCGCRPVRRQGRPPLPSFVADHPFMFMIKEEVSGVVFFTGTVVNPLKED